MADFRVPVQPRKDNLDYEEELDWDNKTNQWTLSDREMGLGKSWLEGMQPQSWHYDSLLQFFRIAQGNVGFDVLSHLSPGELSLIHSNYSKPVTVYAYLCEECGKHWFIFRWEEDQKRWAVYGRTCEFTWKRGDPLTDEEAQILGKVRGIEDNTLTPPR